MQKIHTHSKAHLPSAPLHSGFSSQLSHSAGSDMKADQIQLALPPEMILLIGISSGARNTQHLLASASASWVTVRRGEQTVPGRHFVPVLILYGTCYARRLDCAEFRLTASATVLQGSQHVSRASSGDILIISHPLHTHLLIVIIFCFILFYFF